MTREEALKSFEEENKDFEKTFERYGYQMSPKEVSAVKEAMERNKVAISALSSNKGDLISRQAVLDELEKWDWQELYLPIHFKQILDDVPSVENKGEWIKTQSGDKDFPESIVCSRCKEENSYLEFDEHHEPIHKTFIKSKFCPNCGADMRGKA